MTILRTSGSCPPTTDTAPSDLLCLKRCRADIAVGAVSVGSIVVHLDVFEHAPARLRTRGEALAVDQLHLQGVEEALGAGVAVAVALGAHAAWQAVPIEQVLIDLRAVLVAA